MNVTIEASPIVNIRPPSLRDAFFMVKTIREGFPVWYRRLPYLFFRSLVADCNEQAAGFVSFLIKGNVGEIFLIAVDPDVRRNGVAGILLKSALRDMQQQGVTRCIAKVRLKNLPAQRLFVSTGFIKVKIVFRRFLGDVYLFQKYIQ
jgi:ribosomal protein S18 acetylase RimI-like enzyme